MKWRLNPVRVQHVNDWEIRIKHRVRSGLVWSIECNFGRWSHTKQYDSVVMIVEGNNSHHHFHHQLGYGSLSTPVNQYTHEEKKQKRENRRK